MIYLEKEGANYVEKEMSQLPGKENAPTIWRNTLANNLEKEMCQNVHLLYFLITII